MRVVFIFLFAKNILFDFIFPGLKTAYVLTKRGAGKLLDMSKAAISGS